MQKRLLVPSRVRQVPRQFSWVDHRLVRDHHIERCDPPALALYLFLVTVADAKGLSYYADGSTRRRLSSSCRMCEEGTPVSRRLRNGYVSTSVTSISHPFGVLA